MRFFTSIIALAATATALTITSPKSLDQVDMSKSVNIEWQYVQSDSQNFSIVLVNMITQPPINKVIAKEVKASDEKYTVDGISGIPKANGYQVNFVSTGPTNTGILAQSPQFNVTDVKTVPKTTSTESQTATATASATATATATTNAAASLIAPAAVGSFIWGLLVMVV
ncbi:hypothetical protein KXW98_008214 [Aspergillus fumigatus]|uniref:Threonine rich protein n=2 Tax=Aspergillus fumigatus TaxID=746128 RepID=B0Y7H5_ASPFC|nr:threonine rich protein [Aspergillus fumigatus A1163]KAF4254864.1 hypothetical protein CNMCM8714_004764 [Aspergillus fumigatus]KMK63115.1 threonine rich protein [Aspergillus fumigatus Z5]KAF4262486.1 hypothetical protein CNMCM8812_004502 [Aspergillus fumigatus]KAF4267829.1 hypothetical protein CNMCM8057_008740 [Aspergillus fumigatus]